MIRKLLFVLIITLLFQAACSTAANEQEAVVSDGPVVEVYRAPT